MLFSWARRGEINYGSAAYHYDNKFHVSLKSIPSKTLCGRKTDGHMTADEVKSTSATICERCQASALSIKATKQRAAA